MVEGIVSGVLDYTGDILDDGKSKPAANRQPLVHKTSFKLYDDEDVNLSQTRQPAKDFTLDEDSYRDEIFPDDNYNDSSAGLIGSDVPQLPKKDEIKKPEISNPYAEAAPVI